MNSFNRAELPNQCAKNKLQVFLEIFVVVSYYNNNSKTNVLHFNDYNA